MGMICFDSCNLFFFAGGGKGHGNKKRGGKRPQGKGRSEMKSKDQILKARQKKENIEKRLRFKNKSKRGGISKGKRR